MECVISDRVNQLKIPQKQVFTRIGELSSVVTKMSDEKAGVMYDKYARKAEKLIRARLKLASDFSTPTFVANLINRMTRSKTIEAIALQSAIGQAFPEFIDERIDKFIIDFLRREYYGR